jgi:carboxyl-terminal processing protease
MTDFLFKYLVKQYKPTTLKDLQSDFSLNNIQYQRLLDFASKQGVKVSAKAAEVARRAVNIEVKALLAKFYFTDQAYFQVVNANDQAIARSLQELN